MMFIKNKKLYALSKESKKRIENDIKDLEKLPKGIYAKIKYYDTEQEYHIKILVDKEYLKIDSTNKNYSLIPDMINFLIMLDYSYPKQPPKILCQTNVSLTKKINI
jgi:ubiquitin-protein ligase